MYNRYIPQSDGSYRRDRVGQRQEHRPHPEQQQETKVECHPEPEHPVAVKQKEVSAGSFLRNLLPRGLDTGDLLVIILLLLIAGDCEDDQNFALLTLVIYLFM